MSKDEILNNYNNGTYKVILVANTRIDGITF